MRVVVFGASGRTGSHVVEQALAAGHEVVAFARTPSKLSAQNARLQVAKGDVRNATDVEAAVAGADVVIAALAPVRGDPSTKGVLAAGVANIIAAMKKQGVKRLIYTTGQGVPTPEDRPKLMNKVIGTALKLLAGDVLEDSIKAVEQVKNSGLDWVVVRAPMLTDGPKTGKIQVAYVGQVGRQLSRANYADALLRHLTDDTYLRRMPAVSDA